MERAERWGGEMRFVRTGITIELVWETIPLDVSNGDRVFRLLRRKAPSLHVSIHWEAGSV